MEIQMTANFYLDNGNIKRIDWLEIDPVLKVTRKNNGETKPYEIPITTAEVLQTEYRKVFSKAHKEGQIFTVNRINGDSIGIPFSKVYFWTIKAKVVTESTEKPIVTPTGAVQERL